MENLDNQGPKLKKDKKDKKKESSKSVETMFRSTLANLVQLASMADNKAGQMISINSIIISILVSFGIRQIDENQRLVVPTICLVMVCLLAITFAIMATRPNVAAKAKDINQADPLFFGHYDCFTSDQFLAKMKTIIADNDQVQERMITNIHAQGKVLNRKYALLKISFSIFMYGFPLVILAYIAILLQLI